MNTMVKNFILTPFNIMYKIAPKFELELMYRLKQGYWMEFDNPKTFNEKIQWIKLYDRNPLMTQCSDKYLVRKFVEDVGCSDLLNTLLWQGFSPEEIPFESLPNKFVIKVTHGSTFNIFCTDKKTFDRNAAIRRLKQWLKSKFIICYGEWFYGQEKPRIIVENFIESDDGQQLRDYKVFCFHGEPRYIRIDSDRFSGHKEDLFTPDWTRLDGINMGFPCSSYEFERPACLDKMLEASRKLSSKFNHARVDFYVANQRLYFGEITFTSGAGYAHFKPIEFDLEMGSWLHVCGGGGISNT